MTLRSVARLPVMSRTVANQTFLGSAAVCFLKRVSQELCLVCAQLHTEPRGLWISYPRLKRTRHNSSELHTKMFFLYKLHVHVLCMCMHLYVPVCMCVSTCMCACTCVQVCMCIFQSPYFIDQIVFLDYKQPILYFLVIIINEWHHIPLTTLLLSCYSQGRPLLH